MEIEIVVIEDKAFGAPPHVSGERKLISYEHFREHRRRLADSYFNQVFGRLLPEENLSIGTGSLGEPRMIANTNLFLSRSYCRQFCAMAIARRAVGIDIEAVGRAVSKQTPAFKSMHPDLQEVSLSRWTAIESAVKLFRNVPLTSALREFQICEDTNGDWMEVKSPHHESQAFVRNFELDGIVGSLCVGEPAPLRLRRVTPICIQTVIELERL